MAGNQPISDAQLLNSAYAAVFHTGLYFDACKEWQSKPQAERTWENFNTFILKAQVLRKQQQATTAGRMGYQANLITEEILAALAALLTRATTDSQALATFNETNGLYPDFT